MLEKRVEWWLPGAKGRVYGETLDKGKKIPVMSSEDLMYSMVIIAIITQDILQSCEE